MLRNTLLYFKDFINDDFNVKSYVGVTLFTVVLIIFNYSLDFEDSYLDVSSTRTIGFIKIFWFYAFIYLTAVFLMYKHPVVAKGITQWKFYVFLGLTLTFISSEINFQIINTTTISRWSSHQYFNRKLVAQLNETIFFIVTIILVLGLLGWGRYKGFGLFNFVKELRLYLLLLAIFIPVLYFASLHPDFIESYPRLRIKGFKSEHYLSYFIAYEPFYLLNFITVEWVFRGLLVLGLIQFFDKRAVLLAAVLYCSFHFGKPLGECIGSFFGGYLLGMITYKTKSIWGGVIVHMGIALIMDVFALMAHF
ncbi:MAG: CPBP family intramembrane metalloprotease [Bacteroidetes bacterium]|nr:CPBP family intramembrane metalloprotease [Bacteroidota bacterium]